MSTSCMNEGNAAFVDELYEKALESYSKAISTGAGANGYAARAQTQLRLGNYMEAAQDAGKAIELDAKMSKAHYRKGKALFHLEEFEEAKKCFASGKKLNGKNEEYDLWIRKCDAEIEEEDEVTVEEIATKKTAPVISQRAPSPSSVPLQAAVQTPVPSAVPSAQPKYRHQWYQTHNSACISLFAKKLSLDRVTVQFEKDRVVVQTRDENGDTDFEMVKELSEEIIPATSSFEVLPSKVEISMKKAREGLTWASLEREENYHDALRQYPTSSKRTHDWDKLEFEAKQDEENEKEEGDAAVQKLFQKIYADADDDTRRAMNKSFQESKGTCLSTDWSSVGSKEVTPASRD